MSYKSYFKFTRRDLSGIITLVLIMGFLLAGPLLLHLLLNGQTVALNFTDIKVGIQKSPDTTIKFTKNEMTALEGNEPKLPVKFDPNIATAANWASVGLLPYKIKIINNYLEKGGHFYRATDLEKIYSLNYADFLRVEPLLVFDKQNSDKKLTHTGFTQRGSYFINRETRDEMSGKKPKIKISLNNAGYAEFRVLRELSYINIRDILKYREMNGNFTSLGELKNIGILSSQTFARVKPFLTL